MHIVTGAISVRDGSSKTFALITVKTPEQNLYGQIMRSKKDGPRLPRPVPEQAPHRDASVIAMLETEFFDAFKTRPETANE
jgi:hypothetical protein